MVTKQRLGQITIGFLVFDMICIIIAVSIDQWMVTNTVPDTVSGMVSNTVSDKVSNEISKTIVNVNSLLNGVSNAFSSSGLDSKMPNMPKNSPPKKGSSSISNPQLVYKGLWEECKPIYRKDLSEIWKCEDLEEVTIDIKCVRAMVLLGLFFVSGATLIVTAHLCHLKNNKRLLFAAIGLLVFAGLFLMIGFGVFHAKVYEPRKLFVTLHAGFAFCVIACIVTLFGVGLTIKLARMGEE